MFAGTLVICFWEISNCCTSQQFLDDCFLLGQISEVVNSMKDLIDFCREHKVGPIGKFLFSVFPLFVYSYSFNVVC